MSTPSLPPRRLRAVRPAKPGTTPPSEPPGLTLADLAVTVARDERGTTREVTTHGRELVQFLNLRYCRERDSRCSEEEHALQLLKGLAMTLGQFAYEADAEDTVEIPAAILAFADTLLNDCVLRLELARPDDGPHARDYRVKIVGDPKTSGGAA